MNESTNSPVIFFEMPVDDINRAKSFYEKTLGWNILPTYENYYFALTADSDENKVPKQIGNINGAFQKKDEHIGALRLMIKVEDLDKTIENVLKAGGKIKIPPRKIPGFYYAVIFDSEGNEVNLAQKL